MAPLLALADLMTPVCAMPSGDQRTTDAVTDAVGVAARLIAAPTVGPSHARLALAFNESDEMARLNTGSHWSPETGAMLLQRVAALALAEAGPGWKLTGPGVREGDAALITVVGLGNHFVTERARLTSDYPAGIDCLLVTDQGAVVGLPRTTQIEVI
jgi:alpha-D-ribose 1-methylphosphonate 5-triphosphate synthase subunit PhnH